MVPLNNRYILEEYLAENGKSPFGEWFYGLDAVTAARVDRYVRRMEQGNFGDSKSVGKGVQELRIHTGAGYRVYYSRDGEQLVILLGGGDKKKQSRDIAAAIDCWEQYKMRRK